MKPAELRAIIESRGITQRQLAEETEVTLRTVERWLEGTRSISPSRAKLIRLLSK